VHIKKATLKEFNCSLLIEQYCHGKKERNQRPLSIPIS
jgi:hypothetical protein